MCARSLASFATALLVSAVGFAGCSFTGDEPDARDALVTLAEGLEDGDLKGVAFVSDESAEGPDSPQTAYDEIFAGLGDLEPDVAVSGVEQGETSADGRLTWTWQVATREWSYGTRVALTRGAKDWQVEWSPAILEPTLEPGETLASSTVKADRGDILGAGGSPIVTERRVLRVGLDKSGLSPQQVTASAGRIADLVEIRPRPFVRQARAAGRRAFVPAITYRRENAPQSVLAGISQIPGGLSISDHRPLAPTKDFATAVLGTVGPATAEIVEQSGGRVAAGDDTGLSGLQLRYDERLAGVKGRTVVAVDEEGTRRELFTTPAEDGTALRTTLDPRLQRAADAALGEVGPASALVAIRPSTGAVLAVASGPGSKGQNTATFGQYAPGSTFKVVTALALIRSGLEPGSVVRCPPRVQVDGKRFKNYDDYPRAQLGRITLRRAIAHSCNTALITERGKASPAALAAAAAALGVGVDHNVGFPAFFGEVPRTGSETEAAADLIGQGKVLMSPLSMAVVMASVSSGRAVIPQLLTDHETNARPPRGPLLAGEARALRSMLRAVVTEGSGAALDDVPGEVIAKTGTAEYGETPPLATHAWMIAARGDLAVAVFVDRGESGSRTAGPVMEEFLRAAPR